MQPKDLKDRSVSGMIDKMPVKLSHILDEATAEDGVRLLSLLLGKIPADEVQQQVIVIGRVPDSLSVPEGTEVIRVPRRYSWPMAWGLDLDRALSGQGPEVMYAWSAAAAAAVEPVWRDKAPIVATISDPAAAERSSRFWHSTNGRFGGVDVLCPSSLVQRRLIEAGIPAEATAVIRPAVDFAAIRHAKETISRADLGLPADGRVLLTISPPSRAGGQLFAVWAAAILRKIWPDVSMVIPGTSKEQQRLRRVIERVYCPEMFYLTENRYLPAELLAVADMLVVPALSDIPTGWLAWAMAASVPIVGSAVPAVAEILSDRQNGLLCKPGEPHTLAIRIRTAVESVETTQLCVEAAHSQAYELFAAQRCVDEHLKVIRNLASGKPAFEKAQNEVIGI